MAEAFGIDSLEWLPVRPAITEGVFGRTLMSDGTKIVLTRVAPGGKFSNHRDNYDHLFYFLSGQGIVRAGEMAFDARPGLVLRVPAGEVHSYENTGAVDLELLSLNLPLRQSSAASRAG
jgi:mannose-6-phosphate isomerase-like protein (cupin superfamily)